MAGAALKPCTEVTSGVLSLCGVAVRADKVRVLAARVGRGELAQKLERAVANDNTIVALNVEERQRLVEVLDEAPGSLPDLRHALVAQLKRLSDAERRQRQLRHDQAMGRAQRERPA
jgi:hypothetical protein